MATTDHITTAHQLLDVSLGQPCELVRGHLVMMSPSGFEHGRVVAHITRLLGDFVVRKRLGVLTGAESGFQLARDPDTVRAPDVGFVRKDRVPRTPIPGFFPGAPDLAVEVLSPNDRPRDVQAKVGDWLNAGCRQIWVVDPQARTVTLHGPDDQQRVLEKSYELEGGDILPGLRTSIARFFAR